MLGSVAYITQISITPSITNPIQALQISYSQPCASKVSSRRIAHWPPKNQKLSNSLLLRLQKDWQFSSLAPLDMANNNPNRATTFAIY